jgi:hypothetical protein
MGKLTLTGLNCVTVVRVMQIRRVLFLFQVFPLFKLAQNVYEIIGKNPEEKG